MSISAAPADTCDAPPVEATGTPPVDASGTPPVDASGTPRVETSETPHVELTVDGGQQHAVIAAEIRAMRTSVTDGLAADDYRAVVTGLARMAENLERCLA